MLTKNGTDDTFTPHDKMQPVLEAPFYAMDVRIVAHTMFTGLKVNENCVVLTDTGEEIENLYAVGELVIANLLNKNYPSSGTSVGAGIYEGAITAIHVIETLK